MHIKAQQMHVFSFSKPKSKYLRKILFLFTQLPRLQEYKISDHRPFLDFHESGLPKCEQVKFVRYLGQGLPNLTLNKIYLSYKELLGMNRIEK